AGLSDLGFLARDDRQVAGRRLEPTGVLDGLAHAHVDDDLLHPRDLHHVGQAQFLLEARAQLLEVLLLEAGDGLRRGGGAHNSAPQLLQTRVLSPSSAITCPTRTGPHWPHTSITFDTCTGMSRSMMPP